MEQIYKTLANAGQQFTDSEKETARNNIGAVGTVKLGNTPLPPEPDSSVTIPAVDVIAGQNITLAPVTGGVEISAADTTYSAGSGISIGTNNEISVDTSVVQGKLTAGPNIDIYNDVISTEKAVLNAGTNVSVNSVLDPQTRTVTYTISATGSSGVSATAPLYGGGTVGDPLVLKTSRGLSLVQSSEDNITRLQVTHPVPAPGSTSAGKVLTCDDALGNLSWQTPAPGATYTFSGGLTESSGTVTVDNPLPAPTFNFENYKYLRAEDSETPGVPPTIAWVDPFTISKYRSQSDTWLQESIDTISVQDTSQGDWGIQVSGYDASSMPDRRYLVPAMSANAFLRTDANGKMEWESIPDLDVDYLSADGIEYYNLQSGDNYISLPWNDSRATILQLQSDASVDIYLETDSEVTVHSMLILANAGQGGVHYCAHVVVHYNDELGNARTWDIPFPATSAGVTIDAYLKKVGSGMAATSIGRVTVRKQDEAVQF